MIDFIITLIVISLLAAAVWVSINLIYSAIQCRQGYRSYKEHKALLRVATEDFKKGFVSTSTTKAYEEKK